MFITIINKFVVFYNIFDIKMHIDLFINFIHLNIMYVSL